MARPSLSYNPPAMPIYDEQSAERARAEDSRGTAQCRIRRSQ